MYWLIDAFEAIRDFMGLGGPVLKAIVPMRLLFFRMSLLRWKKPG